MSDNKLVKFGLGGSILAAVCCFTPALVIVLGLLGFSAFVGLLDYVLFPAMGVSLLILGIGLWKWKKKSN